MGVRAMGIVVALAHQLRDYASEDWMTFVVWMGGAGFEPATCGLSNRCSPAELTAPEKPSQYDW